MRSMFQVLIAVLVGVCSVSSAIGDILPPTHQRCAVNGNISVANGRQRRDWAVGCMMTKGGTSPWLAGDPWFDIGVYVNDYLPLSQADKDAVFPVYYSSTYNGDWAAPNSSTTSCDVLPATYSMFGLCWSGCACSS